MWVSGRNEGFAMVRMTCSDVAFRAATASSCVTFSKLLSFTCTYNDTHIIIHEQIIILQNSTMGP